MKVAHLENALLAMRHAEVADAVAWRLDALHTALEGAETAAEDRVAAHLAAANMQQEVRVGRPGVVDAAACLHLAQTPLPLRLRT